MIKKILLRTVFLALFMIIAAMPPAQGALEPVGSIVAMRGTATAHDTQGNVRPLSLKSPVYEHDELKTGPRGRIQVLFRDKTIISLGGESTIKISEYAWKPDTKTGAMKTRVKEGVFRVMGGAITKEAPRNFTTETPAATIGIRGSMYAGKVAGQQLMVVFEGGKGIDVSNDKGSISITNPGFGTFVKGADLPPLPPKPLSKDEVAELNAQLSTPSEPDEKSENGAGASGDEQTAAEPEDKDTGAAAPASSGSGEQAGDDSRETQPETGETIASPSPPAEDVSATQGPLTTSVASVSQDIINTSTATLQNDLENKVTEISRTTGITLTGAFLGQCAADGTATDFTTWYGNTIKATSLAGNVAVSGTDQNMKSFGFSFTMQPYDANATYEPPFVGSGNLNTISLTRYVGFFGVERNFASSVASDNLGEFALFTVQNAQFVNESIVYGYRDLGFAGRATMASQMPTNGVSGYSGYALGVDTQLISGQTMHLDSELSYLFMEVNWLNGKAIGRVSSPNGEDIFFFADVGGATLANIRLCGYKDKVQTSPSGMIAWVEGTAESAQFYGSSYQGIGVTGSGGFYDIAGDQSSPVGSGRLVAAAFRVGQDAVEVTSPTGTVSWNGFVTGLSENMFDPSVNRRAFMSSSSSALSLTANRDAGTLSGLLSATDILSGGSSINNLEIGGSHGSAYVLDDNMVAIIGDTGSDAITSGAYTGGLKTYGNYLVTGAIDEQFSDYVTWGYWEIAYTDPQSGAPYHLHRPGSYWIAGELTPASTISDMIASSITGTYSGAAKGICIDTMSAVSELTNGTSQIHVDFGTSQVTGNITFAEVDLPLSGGTLSASTSSFYSTISGATTSNVNGAFFGPQAQAVGGNFHADFSSGNTYMGIFGGRR